MSRPSYIYFYLDKAPYKLGLQYVDMLKGKRILEVFSFTTYKELLIYLVQHFGELDPSILEKVEQKGLDEWQNNNHRKNLMLSKERSHLFIQSPDLAEKNSISVCGYWLRTNEGRNGVLKFCSSIASAVPVKRRKWGEFKL